MIAEATLELLSNGTRRAVASGAPEPCAVVLAGGRGTRLQHVARRYEGALVPKQFCSFGTGQTLLQHTLERLARVVAPKRTLVVVQRDQLGWAREQLRERELSLVVQPSDAGTGVALLLALMEAAQRFPHAPALVTPADHGFAQNEPLDAAVRRAFACAADGRVVLLGAEADAPRTDFGWILPGPARSDRRAVVRFVEKPPEPLARELQARGALWSTMLAVATVPAWLAAFGRRYPLLVRALVFYAGLPPHEQPDYLERLYQALDPLDLSRDVLETSDALEVVVLPLACGWSDLGTEERLLAHLAPRRAASRAALEAAS